MIRTCDQRFRKLCQNFRESSKAPIILGRCEQSQIPSESTNTPKYTQIHPDALIAIYTRFPLVAQGIEQAFPNASTGECPAKREMQILDEFAKGMS